MLLGKLREFAIGRGLVISAQFSPDGQRVVTASLLGNTARLWDGKTGKPIGEPMPHEKIVYSAQFSPDGQRVVTASLDNTARLWDALTVTASSDQTVRLREAATGEAIGGPMQHEGRVRSAQFSPDGQRVLTASEGGTARLWDVPTISSKDLAEDLLLLAELAEATGGVALRASRQAELRNALTSRAGQSGVGENRR